MYKLLAILKFEHKLGNVNEENEEDKGEGDIANPTQQESIEDTVRECGGNYVLVSLCLKIS